MILKDCYAVVWRVKFQPLNMVQREIVSRDQWMELQKSADRHLIVILECWEITSGKCISN